MIQKKNFISKEEKSGSYYSINHEIVYNTDQLFTLKLELNKAHADSYTKNVYYTINKSTGKSIPLSAYFKNSDYKKVVVNLFSQLSEKLSWSNTTMNLMIDHFNGIKTNTLHYLKNKKTQQL